MFFYLPKWTVFLENRQLGSYKTVVMRGLKMRALIENSEKNIVVFKNGIKTTIL